MEDLSDFERAVLDKLLAGEHPALVTLREQARGARVVSREYTGVGFFITFDLAPDAPRLRQDKFHFGDVNAQVDGLEHGAGFVLFVQGGALSLLEGYTYAEDWPGEIGEFQLTYQHSPRMIEIPDDGL